MHSLIWELIGTGLGAWVHVHALQAGHACSQATHSHRPVESSPAPPAPAPAPRSSIRALVPWQAYPFHGNAAPPRATRQEYKGHY